MRLLRLPDEASEDISDQRMQISGVLSTKFMKLMRTLWQAMWIYLSAFVVQLRSYRIDFYHIFILAFLKCCQVRLIFLRIGSIQMGHAVA
jgi:hypothetical protein